MFFILQQINFHPHIYNGPPRLHTAHVQGLNCNALRGGECKCPHHGFATIHQPKCPTVNGSAYVHLIALPVLQGAPIPSIRISIIARVLIDDK